MRLLLIDSIDFPYGGAHSVHVTLLMKGLRENGENVFLIIPYGRKRETVSSNRNKYGHYENVPYYFVRKNKDIRKVLRFLDIFFGVIKTAGLIISRKRNHKVDGVILAGADLLRDHPIIIACYLFKIPLYFWQVEKMSLSEDFTGIAGFLNCQSQKLSERILPYFAKGIIVISTLLKEHYLKYLPENRILINPILVHAQMNKTIDDQMILQIREKLIDKFKYKHLLVYSGSYGEKDGIFFLIDAFSKIVKKYPGTLFIMTGKNHSNLIMDIVRKYIDNLGLQKEIQLLGFVSSSDLFCYNHLADVLFACRTNSAFANHGFPWKLGEYCMTGRPVIATRVSDIEKYFADHQDLFIVEPGNANEIAKKTEFIFDNFENALEVAKRGKETALKSFGYIEKSKDMVEFIYSTIK